MKELIDFQYTKQQQQRNIILFIAYMFLMPFIFSLIISLTLKLFNMKLPEQTTSIILNLSYYIFMFILCITIFNKFLKSSWNTFKENSSRCIKYIFCGWGLLYLSNLIINLVMYSIANKPTQSQNNTAILDILNQGLIFTFIFAVFLGPFVEEVMFRGILFKGLYNKNKFLAYFVSSFVFGLLHVWQPILFNQNFSEILQIIPYASLGLIFAFIYDRTKTIWTGIFLHMIYNCLSLILMSLYANLKSILDFFQ